MLLMGGWQDRHNGQWAFTRTGNSLLEHRLRTAVDVIELF